MCRPAAAFLARISGQVAASIPTPEGAIEVSFRKEPALVVSVTVPAGTRGVLDLPAACGIATRTLEAGVHEFTARNP